MRKLGITKDSDGNIIDIPDWRNLLEKTAFHPENKKNLLMLQRNGVSYPVIYSFDISLSAFSDQPALPVLQFLKSQFLKNGYSGLIILSHSAYRTEALDRNLFLVNASYSQLYLPNTKGESFSVIKDKLISSYSIDQWKNSVINVPTAAKALPPHFSEPGEMFSHDGSRPEIFKDWLKKVSVGIQRLQAEKQLFFDKPVLSIYNVSEWLEAGASLQPNQRDGFGYLDAVSDVQKSSLENPYKANLLLSKKNLSFSRVIPGRVSEVKKIRVSNSGTAAMVGFTLVIQGAQAQFHVRHNCPYRLEPRAECFIKVRFQPRVWSREPYSVKLMISDAWPVSISEAIQVSGAAF